MSRPYLKSTNVVNETYAGVSYHLEGELVPALTVELEKGQSVYFEHHVLLWKNTSVNVSIRKMSGVAKRIVAGMQVFVTQASGEGQIAFSRNGPGHIFPVHLEEGQELLVREHQFLAATSNIDYHFTRMRGVSNLVFGGTGFFIDKFVAKGGPGILWLHGYGNVFEKVLADGEQIDVEPGSWLYKDPSVKMDTKLQRLSTGLLGSMSFTCNRFTGPGRIGIQSMVNLVSSESK